MHIWFTSLKNNCRNKIWYRRSQGGQDFKPYKIEDENTLCLPIAVISKIQVFQKTSRLCRNAGAYSKPLVTIKAPFNVHL